MASRQENIYTERLLSYWEQALMKKLPNPTHTADFTSDICGDFVEMEAVIVDNRFESLEFFVRGCCLSQCAAAMLVEHFRGKTVDDALAYTDDQMCKLAGIEIPKPRKGCVLLGLQCLRKLCGQAQVKR